MSFHISTQLLVIREVFSFWTYFHMDMFFNFAAVEKVFGQYVHIRPAMFSSSWCLLSICGMILFYTSQISSNLRHSEFHSSIFKPASLVASFCPYIVRKNQKSIPLWIGSSSVSSIWGPFPPLFLFYFEAYVLSIHGWLYASDRISRQFWYIFGAHMSCL